jgi:hypothetical protein
MSLLAAKTSSWKRTMADKRIHLDPGAQIPLDTDGGLVISKRSSYEPILNHRKNNNSWRARVSLSCTVGMLL